MPCSLEPDALWERLIAGQGETLRTVKGLKFTYTVHGGELFVDRRSKSITFSSVSVALRRVQQLDGRVPGPKALGVFGASYLYPIFVRMGLILPPDA